MWIAWAPNNTVAPFRCGGVGNPRTLADARKWVRDRIQYDPTILFQVRVTEAPGGQVLLYSMALPASVGTVVTTGTFDDVWPAFIAHGEMLRDI